MPIDRSDLIKLFKQIHLFRGIDDLQLSAAVAYFEELDVKAGDLVFEQGEDSNTFYIIYHGRLNVSRYTAETHQSHQIGFVEDGDYIGQEVLAEEWPRQVTVTAATDATLLVIDVPNFKTLLNVIPALSSRLQMMLDSYRLMLNTKFAWLDPEEYVYFVARRHILFLFLHIVPPIAVGILTLPVLYLFLSTVPLLATTSIFFIGLALLTLAAWFAWGWIDWSNDYYIVTNRRIIYQERVILLYDTRQESPLNAIQSTSVNSTQIGRILGYGNVAIRTYIGTILFRGISDPQQVMALIQEQQARAQVSSRRAELSQMEKLIEGRIFGGQPTPQPAAPPKSPVKTSPVQDFLSDLFHLRRDIGGTILFRTHWFYLLRKTWVPALLLFGLFAIWLLTAFGVFTLMSLLSVTVLVFGFGLVVGGWWLYQYLDWHNDVYLITPEQIVDVNKKPLGKEERRAAPIKNILSIEYKRLGILGLVLNFGTVYIRVGDQQLTFDEVYNPSEVQRELFNRLAARTHAEKVAAQENERQRMIDWVAAYHRVTQRSQPPRTPPASSDN